MKHYRDFIRPNIYLKLRAWCTCCCCRFLYIRILTNYFVYQFSMLHWRLYHWDVRKEKGKDSSRGRRRIPVLSRSRMTVVSLRNEWLTTLLAFLHRIERKSSKEKSHDRLLTGKIGIFHICTPIIQIVCGKPSQEDLFMSSQVQRRSKTI